VAENGDEQLALRSGERADVDVGDDGGDLLVSGERLLRVQIPGGRAQVLVGLDGPGRPRALPVVRDVELASAQEVVHRHLLIVLAGRVHRHEPLAVVSDLALGPAGLVVLKLRLDVVDPGFRQRVVRRDPAGRASLQVALEPADVVAVGVDAELDLVGATGEREVQQLDDAGVLGSRRFGIVVAPAG